MKSLLVAIALVIVLRPSPVESASFPPPIGGERPVSESILSPAVGSQGQPHVASNGEVALAVWIDVKDGNWNVRGSILDDDGNPLSPPAGVYVDEQSFPKGLYWNGTEFIVLLTDGAKWTRIRIAADGTIIDKVVMSMPTVYQLGAISSDGQRLIFTAIKSDTVEVAIADRRGEMIGDVIRLPTVIGRFAWKTIAAVRGDEFVVLRLSRGTGDSSDVYADRIHMDGTIASSVLSNLVLANNEEYAMAGGPDGYLLVGQNVYDGTANAHRLAAGGMRVGSMSLAGSKDNRLINDYRPAVLRDDGRYLIAWHVASSDAESEIRVAELTDDASALAWNHPIAVWPGATSDIALAVGGSQRIVLASVSMRDSIAPADLYAIPLTPGLTARPSRVVARSQPAHLRIEAAAGDNGFGVAWVENGPDKMTHFLFRRFSRAGALQGDPVRLASVPYPWSSRWPDVAVASNGSVYLVLWSIEDTVWGRRMDAASGVWNDAEPFIVGKTWLTRLAVAAKTSEAVLPLNVREIARLRFDGDPVTIATTGLERPYAVSVTVATNGDGYLMAWVEVDTTCQFDPCTFRPLALMAARLAPDGTALDSEPIMLESGEMFPEDPSIAWAGDRYLVVWGAWVLEDYMATQIHGASVSAHGVVLEGSAPSTPGIALHAGLEDEAVPRVVADGDSFVLVNAAVTGHRTGADVDAVRFWFDTPLRTVSSLPRTVALPVGLADPFVAAAVRSDGTLFLGWIRLADDLAPRGYFQIFGEQERRRPVRR
jgi:hypothetical protein